MLAEGSNFRIHRLDGGAESTGGTDTLRVALNGAVHESGDLAGNIACGFGVGEGLICRRLLEAGKIGHGSRAGFGGLKDI